MSEQDSLQVTLEMEKATDSKDDTGFFPFPCLHCKYTLYTEGCGWLLEQYVHSCKN